MKSLLLVALVAASGCGVSKGDALAFTKVLDAAASVDPDMQTKILIQGCSEVSSCAGSCQKALAACAGVDPDMVAPLLGHCFDDLRAAHDKDPSLKAQDWFRNQYLPPYADKARKLLDGDDAARFDAARAKLHL